MSVTPEGYLDLYPGYRISNFTKGELGGRPYIKFTLVPREKTTQIVVCPHCHHANANIRKGIFSTEIHDINIGDTAVLCNVNIQRYRCLVCNKKFSVCLLLKSLIPENIPILASGYYIL